MNTTGWLRGLEVTAGGTGIVSHAGVALLRALADKTGLTAGLSKALASRRLLVHDRGRVLADLACAIAGGAEVISDFRVMADQGGLFGSVASVPTCWRALNEIAAGGQHVATRVTGAVNAARRVAWAAIEARHGAIPGIAVADKTLAGVTGLRLDATVVACHSEKQGAEPNFKGFGLLTELPELSSQFRERVASGAITVLDHDRARRSSSGYGKPCHPVGWFPSGHGRSVGSVSAGRSVG